MQSTLRPTTLTLERNYCAAAIDLYDVAPPVHVDMFHVGTATHLYLERLGAIATERARAQRQTAWLFKHEEAAAIIDPLFRRYLAEGREFDGVREPPLPVDALDEAKTLAIQFVTRHPFSVHSRHEIGFAWSDEELRVPVGYAPGARYRLIADVVTHEIVEDEELGTSSGVLTVRDYKTAWRSSLSETTSIQMTSQAYAATTWAKRRGLPVNVIRIEIANVRTREIHTREIWLDDHEDGGDALIEEWRSALSNTIKGLAEQRRRNGGRYVARPGLACGGCPYRGACADGQAWVRSVVGAMITAPTTLEDIASAWVAARRGADLLQEVMIGRLDDGGVIRVDGGEIGYVPRTQRRVRSIADALAEWSGFDHGTPELDWLVSLGEGARIGVTALEKLARQKWPDRRDKPLRDAYLERHTDTYRKPHGVRFVKDADLDPFGA